MLRLIPGFLRYYLSLGDRYERARFAFNRLFHHVLGGESRPAFFDVDATYPSLRALDGGFEEIRGELEEVLASGVTIPDYHEIDERQHIVSKVGDPARHWQVFALKAIAGEPVENQRRCPRTTALLQQIPGVTTAFFSILSPGKSIPVHCGPYVGRLRYHLPLIVPTVRPPSMRVKDTTVVWEEGKSILFDDSLEHEIYNDSPDRRVVLLVDVIRPMPLPWSLLNQVAWRIFRHSPRWKEVLRRARTYGAVD